MKCRHKYVAMEDGTNDLFCVRCRKFAMQAVAKLPNRITVDPFTIGSTLNQTQHVGLMVKLEDISKLLREEMEKDMMKATRSRGVL